MKLIRYLALNNIAARREALELIKSGKVSVNGSAVFDATLPIDPEKDIVKAGGRTLRGTPEFFYILMNKPAGFLTARNDEKKRPTVYDILFDKKLFKIAAADLWRGKNEEFIYKKYLEFKKMNINYAGRLDFNTSGALIFSNDGEFIQDLIHPSADIPKTYRVKIFRHLNEREIGVFQKAVYVDIDGKKVKFKAVFKHIRKLQSDMIVVIDIFSGENRIIKRAFQQMGHPVITLSRLNIGKIGLKGLPLGFYRFLERHEIAEYLR